jgi:hypothetical protein
MSSWPETSSAQPALRGVLGELVSVRISVDWRSLEDLLEALARAPFPVNPEIRHGNPSTIVEFPAYASHLDDVRRLLEQVGLEDCRMDIASMFSAIH